MEMGPQLSLTQQTGGAGDQIQDHWVQGKWFIHYTMAHPTEHFDYYSELLSFLSVFELGFPFVTFLELAGAGDVLVVEFLAGFTGDVLEVLAGVVLDGVALACVFCPVAAVSLSILACSSFTSFLSSSCVNKRKYSTITIGPDKEIL